MINVQVLLYGFKKRLKVDSSGGGDFIFSNAHAYLFSHHFKTHKSGELTFTVETNIDYLCFVFAFVIGPLA